MTPTTLRHERASRLTHRMMCLLKDVFRLGDGLPLLDGLPAGAELHDDARLILATTCCTLGLFDRAALVAAQRYDSDVIVMRHGLHPEQFDEVAYDLFRHTDRGAMAVRDLRLYFDLRSGFWLVPRGSGHFFALTGNGPIVQAEPPSQSAFELSDGLCRAARLTIKAAAGEAFRG